MNIHRWEVIYLRFTHTALGSSAYLLFKFKTDIKFLIIY